jgi:hypothetical protein
MSRALFGWRGRVNETSPILLISCFVVDDVDDNTGGGDGEEEAATDLF